MKMPHSMGNLLHMDPELREIKLWLNILDFPFANFKLSIKIWHTYLNTIHPLDILKGWKINQERICIMRNSPPLPLRIKRADPRHHSLNSSRRNSNLVIVTFATGALLGARFSEKGRCHYSISNYTQPLHN
jgi:hypothetical protein